MELNINSKVLSMNNEINLYILLLKSRLCNIIIEQLENF